MKIKYCIISIESNKNIIFIISSDIIIKINKSTQQEIKELKNFDEFLNMLKKYQLHFFMKKNNF